MDKEILSTNKAPAAIGPYSQGIAAGSFVFVSGQLPICAATGEMPEDIKAQAEMSLLNVKAVLEAAGSSLDKVVKTTCFLADINASGRSSFMYNQNVFTTKNPTDQRLSLALAISGQVLGDRGAYRVHGGGFAGTIQAFVPLALLETYKNAIDAVFGAGSCHVLSVRNYGAVMVTPDM